MIITMSKTIIIYSEPKIEATVVIFHINDKEVHRKILNTIELKHLATLFDLTDMPVTLDAEHVTYKLQESPFITKDGEPTHFELLLIDVVHKK